MANQTLVKECCSGLLIDLLRFSYNVMQSDGNIFCFNMAYRDEDIILDQKYEKQIFWDLYYEDFKFRE